MIASFDVFDTLLTRLVGSPKAVFLILGRKLYDEGHLVNTPQEFAYARKQAQSLALSKSAGKDVTLRQIYDELSFSLNLSQEKCSLIMEKEMEVEDMVLKEVPGAKDKIKKEMDKGRKIMFISDMYLPAAFIKAQLVKNGFDVSDNCYVSNEHLKTKHSGELFKHIALEHKLHPSKFHHFGDNKRSDFDVPKKLKWNALHYQDIGMNRYENLLNSYTWQTDGMAGALAGASRYTRLSIPAENDDQKHLRDISASVVAPIFTGFLIWILRRAQELGLKRIYYLSRDGQIYHRMSVILVKKLNLNIQLEYLYSSRKSWQFAAVTEIGEKEYAWILKSKGKFTIENVFKRVYQKAEDFEELLVSQGFRRENWDKKIGSHEIAKLKEIFETRDVKEAILKKAKEQREILLQYLEQEGLTDGQPYAIVDIGWVGTSQNYLSKILAVNGHPPPVGFYLALRNKEFITEFGLKEGYSLDQVKKTGYYVNLINLGALLESFCHADHGSLIGYSIENNNVIPVLETAVNEKAIHWGLPLIQKTLCQFCDHLLIDQKYIDPYIDIKIVAMEILKAFGRKPTAAEAKAWGGRLELECNQEETKWNMLSEPFTVKHIFQALLYGRLYRSTYSWSEGSLAITPNYTRIALKYAAKAGRFGRKLMRRKIDKDEAGVI